VKLSHVVQQDPQAVEELRHLLERGDFPGISLQHAMEFLLSEGVLPEDGLPLASFLRLEDWARARLDALPGQG
jgi:hypothetical protein